MQNLGNVPPPAQQIDQIISWPEPHSSFIPKPQIQAASKKWEQDLREQASDIEAGKLWRPGLAIPEGESETERKLRYAVRGSTRDLTPLHEPAKFSGFYRTRWDCMHLPEAWELQKQAWARINAAAVSKNYTRKKYKVYEENAHLPQLAADYVRAGFSPILGLAADYSWETNRGVTIHNRGKAPIGQWSHKRMPQWIGHYSPELIQEAIGLQLMEWGKRKAVLCLPMGYSCGLVAIDSDTREDTEKLLSVLPSSMTVRSGRRDPKTGERAGGHVYCRLPQGYNFSDIRNKVHVAYRIDGLDFTVDIRSHGGQVVGPGSWHEKGQQNYSFGGTEECFRNPGGAWSDPTKRDGVPELPIDRMEIVYKDKNGVTKSREPLAQAIQRARDDERRADEAARTPRRASTVISLPMGANKSSGPGEHHEGQWFDYVNIFRSVAQKQFPSIAQGERDSAMFRLYCIAFGCGLDLDLAKREVRDFYSARAVLDEAGAHKLEEKAGRIFGVAKHGSIIDFLKNKATQDAQGAVRQNKSEAARQGRESVPAILPAKPAPKPSRCRCCPEPSLGACRGSGATEDPLHVACPAKPAPKPSLDKKVASNQYVRRFLERRTKAIQNLGKLREMARGNNDNALRQLPGWEAFARDNDAELQKILSMSLDEVEAYADRKDRELRHDELQLMLSEAHALNHDLYLAEAEARKEARISLENGYNDHKIKARIRDNATNSIKRISNAIKRIESHLSYPPDDGEMRQLRRSATRCCRYCYGNHYEEACEILDRNHRGEERAARGEEDSELARGKKRAARIVDNYRIWEEKLDAEEARGFLVDQLKEERSDLAKKHQYAFFRYKAAERGSIAYGLENIELLSEELAEDHKDLPDVEARQYKKAAEVHRKKLTRLIRCDVGGIGSCCDDGHVNTKYLSCENRTHCARCSWRMAEAGFTYAMGNWAPGEVRLSNFTIRLGRGATSHHDLFALEKRAREFMKKSAKLYYPHAMVRYPIMRDKTVVDHAIYIVSTRERFDDFMEELGHSKNDLLRPTSGTLDGVDGSMLGRMDSIAIFWLKRFPAYGFCIREKLQRYLSEENREARIPMLKTIVNDPIFMTYRSRHYSTAGGGDFEMPPQGMISIMSAVTSVLCNPDGLSKYEDYEEPTCRHRVKKDGEPCECGKPVKLAGVALEGKIIIPIPEDMGGHKAKIFTKKMIDAFLYKYKLQDLTDLDDAKIRDFQNWIAELKSPRPPTIKRTADGRVVLTFALRPPVQV